MDLNLIVLAGKMASEPELVEFESGSRLLKCLITVRLNEPRQRIDVIPVVLWDPSDELLEDVADTVRGLPVWVAGSVQRRFWAVGEGRTSRIEVVAHDLKINRPPVEEDDGVVDEGEEDVQ